MYSTPGCRGIPVEADPGAEGRVVCSLSLVGGPQSKTGGIDLVHTTKVNAKDDFRICQTEGRADREGGVPHCFAGSEPEH